MSRTPFTLAWTSITRAFWLCAWPAPRSIAQLLRLASTSVVRFVRMMRRTSRWIIVFIRLAMISASDIVQVRTPASTISDRVGAAAAAGRGGADPVFQNGSTPWSIIDPPSFDLALSHTSTLVATFSLFFIPGLVYLVLRGVSRVRAAEKREASPGSQRKPPAVFRRIRFVMGILFSMPFVRRAMIDNFEHFNGGSRYMYHGRAAISQYIYASSMPTYLLLHGLLSPYIYQDPMRHLQSFHDSTQILLLVPIDLGIRVAFGPTHWVTRDDVVAAKKLGGRGGGTLNFTGATGVGPTHWAFGPTHSETTSDEHGHHNHLARHRLTSLVADVRRRKELLTAGDIVRELWWGMTQPGVSMYKTVWQGILAPRTWFGSSEDLAEGLGEGCSNGSRPCPRTPSVTYLSPNATRSFNYMRSVGNAGIIEGIAILATDRGSSGVMYSASAHFLTSYAVCLHGIVTFQMNFKAAAFDILFRTALVAGNVRFGMGWWLRALSPSDPLLPYTSGFLPRVYASAIEYAMPAAFLLVALQATTVPNITNAALASWLTLNCLVAFTFYVGVRRRVIEYPAVVSEGNPREKEKEKKERLESESEGESESERGREQALKNKTKSRTRASHTQAHACIAYDVRRVRAKACTMEYLRTLLPQCNPFDKCAVLCITGSFLWEIVTSPEAMYAAGYMSESEVCART